MFRNLSGIVFLAAAATLLAQDPAPAPTDTPAPPAAAAAPNPPGLRAPSSDPQPYDKVITKDAKSATGIFIVHQVKDRFYCEIPKGELDKEFLLNVRVSKTTVGVGYGGDQMSDHVVRWELNGNKVHLRDMNYSVTADPNTPIALAVKAANNDTILMTFPVGAFAKVIRLGFGANTQPDTCWPDYVILPN
jgi:hypothetical protein